jgi:glucosyl-3-phosphoglycerate synthase
MADFYQHARLPTLHHLASPDATARDEELVELTRDKPVALLLPALFVETQRPALPAILEQVSHVPYISEVLLTMNGMEESQVEMALRLCRESPCGKKVNVLWNDGPALQAAHHRLSEKGWDGTFSGKGANIWMGLACLKAAGHTGIVISHDTDILNYSRSMLAKLCFPVAHPRLNYRFAKGYYSRVADRLYGRVTRLLIFPLIQAFQDVLGMKPLLEHLESFRYPLSGEFAGELDTLAEFNLPPAWGLEIAILCESHRYLTPAEQCQVDLGFHFEHRHRQLLTPGLEQGLVAAAADVVRCLTCQILRDAEVEAVESLLRMVLERYSKHRAHEWMQRYEHVALLNGLIFDEADERLAIQAFTEALEELIATVSANGLHVPGMRPSPAQALKQLPGLGEQIVAAVL